MSFDATETAGSIVSTFMRAEVLAARLEAKMRIRPARSWR